MAFGDNDMLLQFKILQHVSLRQSQFEVRIVVGKILSRLGLPVFVSAVVEGPIKCLQAHVYLYNILGSASFSISVCACVSALAFTSAYLCVKGCANTSAS